MLKSLTIAFASMALAGGTAASASACGGCSSSCMAMPMSDSGMNAAPTRGMEGMEMPPAPQAPSAARATRRYSYEPSMRSYSAPRTRTFRSSPNALPKSDPGRYNF